MPLLRLIVRPLFEWATRHAFLAGVSLCLLGIVANIFLWQLGLPSLFWHESWLRRLFAGVGVGLYAVNAGVVGFLLASRRPWIAELQALWPAWTPRNYAVGMLTRYLLLTSAVFVTAVWLSALRAPDHIHGLARVGFPAAVTLGAVLAASGLWLTHVSTESHVRRRTAFGLLLATLDKGPSGPSSSPGGPGRWNTSRVLIPIDGIHRAAAVFFVGQLLFYLACGVAAATSLGKLMSAGFVLALFSSALVSGYGAVRWWSNGGRLFWFPAIVVAWIALAAIGPYRHTLVALSDEYSSPVPVTSRARPNGDLLDSGVTIGAWAARGGSGPLVVLAVDGGGIRAATWIVSMLTTLEKDLPVFPYSVRFVTGASGGMVGAAYYVSTLQKPDTVADGATHAKESGAFLSPEAMLDAISKDSLEATVRRLVFRDISPVVWRSYADRGYALEHEWEQNTESMRQTFAALAPGEAEGWRPSLLFSPTIVEDGRRLLISNLDLEKVSRVSLPLSAPAPRSDSVSALELAKLVPTALRKLHVSTVARINAAFPYVSPAAEIPTQPLRRVVDAGYYDEHGVALAAAWILANEEAIRAHARKVALIQIPDQRSDPKRLPNPCASRWWTRGLSDLLSPPQAVLAGWSGAMRFRNDEVVQALSRRLNQDGAEFRSYVFEPYDPVPVPTELDSNSGAWQTAANQYCEEVQKHRPVALSWTMIEKDRELLRKSPNTEPNCTARRDLVQWWTGQDPGQLEGCKQPVPEPTPAPPDLQPADRS